jgi:ribosome biogenesis GTPase A
MENNRNASDVFVENMMKVVYKVLRKENLLQSEFHMGKVAEVLPNYYLSIYIDGSSTTQKVKCNPDITFHANDQVIVIFINNDSKNKYVMSRVLF